MEAILYNMDSANVDILLKKSGHDKNKLHDCSICEKKITKSEIVIL